MGQALTHDRMALPRRSLLKQNPACETKKLRATSVHRVEDLRTPGLQSAQATARHCRYLPGILPRDR